MKPSLNDAWQGILIGSVFSITWTVAGAARSTHNPTSLSSSPEAAQPLLRISPPALSYADIGEIYDNKLSDNLGKAERSQMAVYAREVFIQQPNRMFVRVNIITPMTVRILLFDRSGCYYSQPVNYHSSAGAIFLVKLVLLGSAFDESLIGFDTSIYWENGRRKMKLIPPRIYDNDAGEWRDNITKTVYVFVIDPKPLFSRRTIRSRGTVCWRAVCNGVSYVIKDYWRGDGRILESEILQDLSGIPGIGQMLCFENDRFSIKELRGIPSTEAMKHDSPPSSEYPPTVINRYLMRIVVVEYGATLDEAVCAHQFLCAIRDIVKGHHTATIGLDEDKRVLQSDISPFNIRLAYDRADQHAVLIDWDLAKRMARLIAGDLASSSDLRTGTEIYHSVRVHMGDAERLSHLQPMDDLESIYYVIIYVLCGFDEHGEKIAKLPPSIQSWMDGGNTPKAMALAPIKRSFLLCDLEFRVTRFPLQHDILMAVIHQLHHFFRTRITAIGAATRILHPTPLPPYNAEQAKSDYAAFLAPIEQGIMDLEAGGVLEPYSRPPPTLNQRQSKRKSNSVDDVPDAPPTKRVSGRTRSSIGTSYAEADTSGSEDQSSNSAEENMPESPSAGRRKGKGRG
ncbi:hypothetical protein MIND_01002100 [Mycena indigotica]|uniref:Fungal-type protein kinase domain-containing protein n=1 Tax=Mycena indigotica TaxID=2126181 RepID=A0A8H6S972_9AGAR|nr:uncharacterized protein MIND_01002100 [Mycena indigotica]KAF7294653.1 hypothetical protein MIND_01002100 [Mycena indigotica]